MRSRTSAADETYSALKTVSKRVWYDFKEVGSRANRVTAAVSYNAALTFCPDHSVAAGQRHECTIIFSLCRSVRLNSERNAAGSKIHDLLMDAEPARGGGFFDIGAVKPVELDQKPVDRARGRFDEPGRRVWAIVGQRE